MPNVAGREFPYTPQGMAAAEQYKQSLGMRGGGMMGFRPVGYRDGDLVEDPAEEAMRIEPLPWQDPTHPPSSHAKYYPYEEPDPSLIPLREPGTGLPQSIPSGMRHGGIMSLRRR